MSEKVGSIRRRLLVALISILLLVWLVVVVLVYRAAEHEVEEVFDADLARSARTLHALLLHEAEEEQEMSSKVRLFLEELGSEGRARYPRLASALLEYEQEETRERLEIADKAQHDGSRYGAGLILVARYADGSILLQDAGAHSIPLTGAGFSDLLVGEDVWRIYCLVDPQTGFTLQLGERHAFRDELVRDITRNTLLPLFVALPVLAFLIWLVVGRALVPLQRVAGEVARRAPDSLDAISPSGAPREIHSLLAALNNLFTRMRAALDRERQFTADAAHELRTPLAAMKTHLQVALGHTRDEAARSSIQRAMQGVDRATHSVAQLLLLARADAEQTQDMLNAPADLREVARESVALLSQLAIERDIDLGVNAPEPVVVRGDRDALLVMLRNLVDNAVRYTPRGGCVTVTVGEDSRGRWVGVSDDGPGIAGEEQEQIFRRFRRGVGEQAAGTTGTGLGLSIVQRIARLHGARLELGPGLAGAGLGVTLVFPSP
jgi:two-component system sensor histidine kinase QseC